MGITKKETPKEAKKNVDNFVLQTKDIWVRGGYFAESSFLPFQAIIDFLTKKDTPKEAKQKKMSIILSFKQRIFGFVAGTSRKQRTIGFVAGISRKVLSFPFKPSSIF